MYYADGEMLGIPRVRLWPTLQHSRSAVNRAGETLASPIATDEETRDALDVLNDWRGSHAFPLNTIQMALRRIALDVDSTAIIAQRLKRAPTIVRKLKRIPGMQLARMQDIGGCRAVLASVDEAEAVADRIRRSQMKHQFVSEKDYIAGPKRDGYRGIHLVYRYQSERSPDWNSHVIEIQIRTLKEHAWATAVETVDTMLREGLKFGAGPEDWHRFFALMSSFIARGEGRPPVPDTPDDEKDLLVELARLERDMDIARQLTALREALNMLGEMDAPSGRTFALLLLRERILHAYWYKKEQLEEATRHYITLEKSEGPLGGDVVLVATEGKELARAYPNYFLNTELFLNELRIALRRAEEVTGPRPAAPRRRDPPDTSWVAERLRAMRKKQKGRRRRRTRMRHK